MKTFEITLAGHSGNSGALDNLILWVVAETIDEAVESLCTFKNLVLGQPKEIDVCSDDFGVDFCLPCSDDQIKSIIQTKYDAAIGESMTLLDPVESSAYQESFTGRFDGLRVAGENLYLVIVDGDDNSFDCEASEVATDDVIQ